MKHAFVLLNPFSRGGKGKQWWHDVAATLSDQFQLQVVETTTDWEASLTQALNDGVRIFIAAGGDGTVNELLNALMRHNNDISLASLFLGAVGLGSSNDFHKPYTSRVPVKVNVELSRLRDVGVACYRDSQGLQHERYFIVSGSIGVTAEANHFFNSREGFLWFLKRRHTNAAIIYAALKTIFSYHPFPVSLCMNEYEKNVRLNSLNILKTPYVSGSFRLDIPLAPDDGRLGMALMENMNLPRMLRALINLSRGRFIGSPGCSHWSTDKLKVKSEYLFALELDGEVVTATEVNFSLYPERINECL